MKKSYLVIASSLLSIFFIYILLFIYTFLNFDNEFKFTFSSLDKLNFHKKYSKTIHHMRDESVLSMLFKEAKTEDLLFTEINEIKKENKTVLFQGDSYMEQITFVGRKRKNVSVNLIKKFSVKNKINFINAGTTSYAPSLMSLQLDVLEKDFGIFPDMVVAYIDQTDIGDEVCRYKNNKVYTNGILKSVEPEANFKTVFNYSKVYGLSEIYLNNNSKILKTFKLINFKFKNSLKKSSKRFYRKYISQNSKDKEKLKKCYWDEIEKNLINPKKQDIKYFEKSVKEYLNKLQNKKHIKKIMLVTFPHKKHFLKKTDGQNIYKFNVSSVIDTIVEKEKNILHINFSETLLNDSNFEFENIWLEDNVHLNYENHGNILIKKILDELQEFLLL